MIYTAYDRFPTTHPMSIRALLIPPAIIVHPVLFFDHISPHSIVFLGKRLKPFGLGSSIHIAKMSNAEATLMFRVPDIMKTIV